MRSEASLTAVVLTLNEERNIEKCLSGVPDGIPTLVVDSGSSDNTVALARQHGSRVIETVWRGFAGQRNHCVRECGIETEWVLFVDADEVFSEEFFTWAEHFIKSDPPIDVVHVSSRLVLDNTILQHAPGYPIYHPRLVRRLTAEFVQGNTGHNEAVSEKMRIKEIDIPYLHYWHAGPLHPWMDKHLGLAAQEIEHRRATSETVGHRTNRMRLNALLGPGPLRSIARFLYHYVARGGFRDGSAGLRYSLMYLWYEVTKWVMSKERLADSSEEARTQQIKR